MRTERRIHFRYEGSQRAYSYLAPIVHDASAANAPTTGSLAGHPFDILNEYALGFHGSECPPRFASGRFRDEP